MRTVKRISLVIFIFSMVGLPALAGGDVHLLLGKKGSSESRFDNTGTKDQDVAGLMLNLDFEKPVVLAVDLLFSSDDGTRTVGVADPLVFLTDVETTELDLGVRKLFHTDGRYQPYFGGGIAWISLDARQTVSGNLGGPGLDFTDTILDDSDSAFGFWVNAGFRFRWENRFSLGVDARYSSADARLMPVGEPNTIDFDAGGGHYGVTFGYAW